MDGTDGGTALAALGVVALIGLWVWGVANYIWVGILTLIGCGCLALFVAWAMIYKALGGS